MISKTRSKQNLELESFPRLLNRLDFTGARDRTLAACNWASTIWTTLGTIRNLATAIRTCNEWHPFSPLSEGLIFARLLGKGDSKRITDAMQNKDRMKFIPPTSVLISAFQRAFGGQGLNIWFPSGPSRMVTGSRREVTTARPGCGFSQAVCKLIHL